MAAELTTPENILGAVLSDINARRGRIISMEQKDGLVSIAAIVPLAEALRSSPHGRPDYPLRFAGYQDVPRGGFFDGDAPARANMPGSPWHGGSSSAATPETEF
jgi:translation elongation factor EF-G